MSIPLAERLKRLEQVVGLTLPKEDDFGFDVTGVITISLYEYDHLPLSPKMGITAQTQQMFTSMGQNTGSISFVSKSLMRFSSSSYCYYF